MTVKREVTSPDRIMELGFAFQGAKTLLSAVELGVFTALGDGPLDLAALRERVGIYDRGARDFLDALVALGMLMRDEDGRYANTAETGLYLDASQADLCRRHAGTAQCPAFRHLGLAHRSTPNRTAAKRRSVGTAIFPSSLPTRRRAKSLSAQ